jgi:hypothetical protein
MEEPLTPPELLAAVNVGSARPLTASALKRLVREGLLERPVQEHPRGQRGSTSYYPVGTLRQLRAVLRLREQERRFHQLRVQVWWEGLWVDPQALRDSFRTLLDPASADARRLLAGFADAVDAAPALVQEMTAGTGRGRRGLLLRRLGGDEQDLISVTTLLLQLCLGEEPIWESTDAGLEEPEPSPTELFERAAGVTYARRDRLGDSGPLLTGEVDTPDVLLRLRDAGLFEIADLPRLLVEASEEQLGRARADAQLLEQLAVIAAAAEVMHGRDVAGLASFRLLGDGRAATRAFLARNCLAMQGLMDAEAIAEVRAAVVAASGPARVILLLHRALPQYRHLLGPDGERRVRDLPRPEREALHLAVAEVLAAHPEVEALLDEAAPPVEVA